MSWELWYPWVRCDVCTGPLRQLLAIDGRTKGIFCDANHHRADDEAELFDFIKVRDIEVDDSGRMLWVVGGAPEMTIKCDGCGGDVVEELVGDEDFTVLMCIDCGEHPDPEIEDAYYDHLNQQAGKAPRFNRGTLEHWICTDISGMENWRCGSDSCQDCQHYMVVREDMLTPAGVAKSLAEHKAATIAQQAIFDAQIPF